MSELPKIEDTPDTPEYPVKEEALEGKEPTKAELAEDARSAVGKTLAAPAEPREVLDDIREQRKLFRYIESRFAYTDIGGEPSLYSDIKPKHYKRPRGLNFANVLASLKASPELMYSLYRMIRNGGAPDIIAVEKDAYVFADCRQGGISGRINPTLGSPYPKAILEAKEINVDMMDEERYKQMQKKGKFDLENRTMLKTPDDILKEGFILIGTRNNKKEEVEVSKKAFDPKAGYDSLWRAVLRVPKVNAPLSKRFLANTEVQLHAMDEFFTGRRPDRS
jgi:hypothetical protein